MDYFSKIKSKLVKIILTWLKTLENAKQYNNRQEKEHVSNKKATISAIVFKNVKRNGLVFPNRNILRSIRCRVIISLVSRAHVTNTESLLVDVELLRKLDISIFRVSTSKAISWNRKRIIRKSLILISHEIDIIGIWA